MWKQSSPGRVAARGTRRSSSSRGSASTARSRRRHSSLPSRRLNSAVSTSTFPDAATRLPGRQPPTESSTRSYFSYGGYLAAGLARRQPEAFDGLFLACTAFRIHPEDRELPATATVSPRWLPSVSAEFRDHLAAALGTPWEAVARDIDTRLLNLPPADDSYLAQLREQGYPLSDEDTPFVYDRPVALVLGRQDRIAGYASQFRALDAYPAATFTLLDHAGHYLPFERPKPFKASVREWLARISIHEPTPEQR
jgi:Alpha/beta hydrolase family